MLKLTIRSWLPPSQNSTLLIIEFVFLSIFIGWLFVKTRNKQLSKILFILLFLWIISLLPYTSLSVDTKGVESERFLYLPSLFICLTISIFIFYLNTKWRLFYLSIITVLNVFILSKHAVQYRFAGLVVSKTIEVINTVKNVHHLFAVNVPQENHGALIFRSGFKEGINWLKHGEAIDSISILSQSNTDLPLQKNYPAVLSNEISLTNDSIANRLTDGDVYCMFTDSALIVIRKNRIKN